jgi:hypothetical protein
VVIALVLISGFSAAVWSAYRTGFLTLYSEITRWRIKGEAGQALARLSEDLRLAESLTAAAAGDLTLTRDTDDDGDDDSVQYSWSGVSGDPLNRVADVTVPVLNALSSLAFSYYDSGGNLLSFPVTASQVRLVSVELTTAAEDETLKLRSEIRLRKL